MTSALESLKFCDRGVADEYIFYCDQLNGRDRKELLEGKETLIDPKDFSVLYFFSDRMSKEDFILSLIWAIETKAGKPGRAGLVKSILGDNYFEVSDYRLN